MSNTHFTVIIDAKYGPFDCLADAKPLRDAAREPQHSGNDGELRRNEPGAQSSLNRLTHKGN